MFLLEEKAVIFFAMYKGLSNNLDKVLATAFMSETGNIL